MQAIATGGYPVVAERLPHGGIVHGWKVRAREKMVKRKEEACTKIVENTEGREWRSKRAQK
jgi:hypothetical protein